jgi:hypothetical protein
MNDLEVYFKQASGRFIHKWNHYFDVYDRHFARFRGKPVTVLEIGIFQGGSLLMWKNYFGEKVKIYGIDIDPRCKEFEEENIKIFIGSQSDRKFLQEVKNAIPAVDILIDDGGHYMNQQIVTFEELFDHVKDNGVYLAEDLHTSYWLKYGGGYKRKGTFIEYSKKFIDYLNAWHSEQNIFRVNKFTENVDSVHYYDSILVIEKGKKERPYEETTGNRKYPEPLQNQNKFVLALTKISRIFIKLINKVLRFLRLPGFIWR